MFSVDVCVFVSQCSVHCGCLCVCAPSVVYGQTGVLRAGEPLHNLD